MATASSAAASLPSTQAPTIVIHDASSSSPTGANGARGQYGFLNDTATHPFSTRVSGDRSSFLPITTAIPTGSLEELMSPDKMQFSNRGSIIMLDNDKRWSKAGSNSSAGVTQHTLASDLASPTSVSSGAHLTVQRRARSAKVLSADEISLSARVRNMYEYGVEDPSLVDQTVLEEDEDEDENEEEEDKAEAEEPNAEAEEHRTGSAEVKTMMEEPGVESEQSKTEAEDLSESTTSVQKPIEKTNAEEAAPIETDHIPQQSRHTPSRVSIRRDGAVLPQRQPFETAGGIEDWEDIKGEEVDRYGFILSQKTDSRGSVGSGGTYNHNVTTSLLEISNTPRRKQGVLRRVPSRASSRAGNYSESSGPSRRDSTRRWSGINQHQSDGTVYQNARASRSQTSIRSHMARQDRRLLVEAADMLTLPPGATEEAGKTDSKLVGGPTITKAMRQKEWEREAKWKKMGRLRSGNSGRGGGMQFDFDPRDPKVISRTWKGIPDKWRAMAWYSFLEASANKHPESPSEDTLVAIFHELQNEASADDVQIDCDVPRTITRHIMFRRRYRGGQRLLFRVLHALSIYFPEVGYVQGMAALAATLLCYYDEERTFVMMVRLWQLRGLERLYQSGFEGLMEALGDFEKHWLGESDVAKKLASEELCIGPTAYGTRWYLTLFNYSIPFQAQLRVWDVFMLLGDELNSCSQAMSRSKKPSKVNIAEDSASTNTKQPSANSFNADLDVLHATSAALIDATREILLDSDFENAMKVLTSWIPVKDEDLLMKVANAEWKARKKRAGMKVIS